MVIREVKEAAPLALLYLRQTQTKSDCSRFWPKNKKDLNAFDGVTGSFQHSGLHDRWLKSDEKTLMGKLHVTSKRYTQRIERHNLNLRQHLARLTRKTLSFLKSVEMHDRVMGDYLNIHHYQ
ncbi:transposase [Xenorhabdus budapestensis]|uniref:Transposase n=1 Tax=Xenorhabdus budapestensis TaxID=290110 RepID=A0A2D0J2C6_XENBU|nr:transposase [Xenorhabdus budapestensis]